MEIPDSMAELEVPLRTVRLAGLAVLASSLFAQGNLGGLTGTVTDSAGAIVPEAMVTARNLQTNLLLTSRTTAAGLYAFRALQPGLYQVEAEKTGFKKFVQEQVPIQTATTSTLDIQLVIGQVTEAVTVSGDVVTLQTTSPEIGTVLDRRAILDLPIQVGGSGATTAATGRRQPENFIFLTPGVVGIPWSKNINGSPDFTNEVLYDGISAQLAVTPGFLAQSSPPYEAIEEFKVQNTLFPAEFGRGLGVLNFTFKSGTNQFHGGAFEFFRNDKLDARPFFARIRPRVRYNEYGFSIGGPVVFPKLYNGKNRLFFNFNYTGLQNVPPPPSNLHSLPPAEFRQGDFSNFRDNANALIPIFDPATTLADGTRTPFAGNRLPANRLSPITRNLLTLVPSTDLPGYFNNFLDRTYSRTKDTVWSIKSDYLMTQNQRLSFVYWTSYINPFNSNLLGQSTPLGFSFFGPIDALNWRVNYDQTITPTLLHHFGMGFTKSNPIRQLDTRKGNETLKIPGVPNDSPGYALFNIANPYGSLALGNSNQQPNDPSINRNYSFVDNFTWVRGSHQLKWGADVRFFQYDNFNGTDDGGLSGTFNFNPLSTANIPSPDAARQGNGWASALLGQVFSAQRLIPAPLRRMRGEYYAWYVEDVFRATRKLTLTLGFRHEVPTVIEEADSRQSYLHLGTPNAAAGGRNGALVFLKPGELLTPNYLKAFSPRLGIAYSITPKTVLRTGFGVFYSPTNATSVGRVNRAFVHGFSFSQNFPQLTGGREPALLLDNGLPAFTGTLPNTSPTLQNGNNIDFMNPGAGKPGYVSSWTFNLQRELPWRFMIDVGYVGQRGSALSAGLENLNQVPFESLRLGNTLNLDINSAAAGAAGVRLPFPGFRGSVGQALRPYPQFTGIRNLYQPVGWSTYHSLQMRLIKQYASGMSVLVSYTMSKAFVSGAGYTGLGDDAANAVPLDTANRKLEKRLASFDRPQNLILSWTYDLPFGRGRKYLANTGRGVDLLLGGWELAAIQRYISGTPVGVGGGGPIPLFNGGNRPNWISPDVRGSASCGAFDPGRDLYLNSSAFAQPAQFTLGNAPALMPHVRTCSLLNEDFSILKNMTLFESHKLQFRAEMFNIFNRVVFGGPAASLNAPATFGRVAGQANTPRNIQFVLKYVF